MDGFDFVDRFLLERACTWFFFLFFSKTISKMCLFLIFFLGFDFGLHFACLFVFFLNKTTKKIKITKINLLFFFSTRTN